MNTVIQLSTAAQYVHRRYYEIEFAPAAGQPGCRNISNPNMGEIPVDKMNYYSVPKATRELCHYGKIYLLVCMSFIAPLGLPNLGKGGPNLFHLRKFCTTSLRVLLL